MIKISLVSRQQRQVQVFSKVLTFAVEEIREGEGQRINGEMKLVGMASVQQYPLPVMYLHYFLCPMSVQYLRGESWGSFLFRPDPKTACGQGGRGVHYVHVYALYN